MIKANQVPKEVAIAYRNACQDQTKPTARDVLAAAINAWPGMHFKVNAKMLTLYLPLPQESGE